MNKEYIERDAVLQNFKEVKPVNWDNTEYEKQAITDYNFYRSIVENAPVVDVAPVRHGKWKTVFRGENREENLLECSECGSESPIKGKWCYECGAKMDGGNK